MWKQSKAIIILVLIVGGGYGGHMLDRYIKVEKDSAKRAAEVIRPRQGDDDVAEFGYIYSMRDEVFLRDDNKVNLVWFIKVPETGARYSCQYEYGFPKFRTGDDVRVIRPKDLVQEAGYGYIIGLRDKVTDRVAEVWVNDEEQLEMDMPEPDLPEP
jgi:hypothetical protein